MQECQESVGFVGLGQLGQPIAQRLRQAIPDEMPLRIFDQQSERMAPLLAQGALSAECLEEVVRPGGIIFTRLPDDRVLLHAALSQDGILKRLGTGGLHLSLSTGSPQVSRQLARAYHQQGCAYLAAPVLGCPDLARQGKLFVFLAGDLAAKVRVQPWLFHLSQHLLDLGEQAEVASIASLATHVLMASAIEAMGEAVALGERYGLERESFLRLLRDSSLFAGVVSQNYGTRIGQRDFSVTSFSVERGLQVLRLASQAAERRGMSLPTAELASAFLRTVQAGGHGSEDWSVLSECCRLAATGEPVHEEKEEI